MKQSIVEAGMGALVMHAEDEVRVVATSTPDHEAVGWMNEIIEQIFQRCLRLHVSPEMLNNQLEKMQKKFFLGRSCDGRTGPKVESFEVDSGQLSAGHIKDGSK